TGSRLGQLTPIVSTTTPSSTTSAMNTRGDDDVKYSPSPSNRTVSEQVSSQTGSSAWSTASGAGFACQQTTSELRVPSSRFASVPVGRNSVPATSQRSSSASETAERGAGSQARKPQRCSTSDVPDVWIGTQSGGSARCQRTRPAKTLPRSRGGTSIVR